MAKANSGPRVELGYGKNPNGYNNVQSASKLLSVTIIDIWRRFRD